MNKKEMINMLVAARHMGDVPGEQVAKLIDAIFTEQEVAQMAGRDEDYSTAITYVHYNQTGENNDV